MTNRERVGRALDLLRCGLERFVCREMGEQEAQGRFANMDVAALLSFMDRSWNNVFRPTIGRTARSLVNELRDVRNDWAHQKAFSNDDAFRALDSMHRLLTAISAPEAGEVENLKMEVLPMLSTEQGDAQGSSAPPAQPAVRQPTVGVASGRDGVKCIAVDWSGAEKTAAQKKGIWIAEAVNGELRRLESGRTRNEVVGILVKEIQSPHVVIGLDFAFSFPEWYLQWWGLRSVRDLWELVGKEGEAWLKERPYPFWGGGGTTKPPMQVGHTEYRETEEHLRGQGYPPQSTFKLGLPGSVGTGTVRGLSALIRLQDAGAAIWPFDVPGLPMVVEIYPRLLTGEVVKSSHEARIDYLTRRYRALDLQKRPARDMVVSHDAFDAGVSALVMSAHAEDFGRLERATGPPKSLEGEIWSPS